MDRKRLEVLIRSYEIKNKGELAKHLNFYRNLQKIDDAITKATFAICENGKRHGHQRRTKSENMKKVQVKLLENKRTIMRCRNFDDLIEMVKKASVKGFGELAIYDTSLRLSAFLDILPDKVFLHAGTLKGAKAINLDTSYGYLQIEQLPKEFGKLSTYEIEDMLCIYKDRLRECLKDDVQQEGGNVI